jgi:hypothetical protein
MGKWIEIKNWDKFQHYKDRNPPWIKLHSSILNDYDFLCLQDASKAHLMLLWVLASQTDNHIPSDLAFLEKRLCLTSKIKIDALQKLGFIRIVDEDDNDSGSLSKGLRGATPSVSVSDLPLLNKRFEEFWKAYPKKKSKGQAEKAWAKIKPTEQLHNEILESLERAKKSADWTKDGGQFIPYPATWLNAKGWEDEYTEIKEETVFDRMRKRAAEEEARSDQG